MRAANLTRDCTVARNDMKPCSHPIEPCRSRAVSDMGGSATELLICVGNTGSDIGAHHLARPHLAPFVYVAQRGAFVGRGDLPTSGERRVEPGDHEGPVLGCECVGCRLPLYY